LVYCQINRLLMHILLINPNRYKFPPVVPLGIEYLAGALENSNHSYDVLDLCFSDDPVTDILNAFKKSKPGIVGFTIRQADTVLYQNNEFFLDEIKEYIKTCKALGYKVVAGGAGFSVMPREIMDFTGVDYGISGPGEIALVRLLDALQSGSPFQKLTDGYNDFTSSHYSFPRKKAFDYTKYLDNEGIIGFRTQIGCNGECIFCSEAGKKIIFHQPDDVGEEILKWKDMGYSRFHLCDSEFNLHLPHSVNVCKSIGEIAGVTNWALYMKLHPFSDELFHHLSRSGAALLTLSLDTVNAGEKYFEEISTFLTMANDHNIKVAIDLSTGYPHEEKDNLKAMLECLEKNPVETVGINAFYRIYPGTGLYRQIVTDPGLKNNIPGNISSGDFIRPVFYNSFSVDELMEITGNSEKFRIEGFEKATNYQRIGK
jgi:radical SAM superfamily enzyme YgiQ (UPF0313 family)